jgi:TusA-related sulfurtransferase
MTPHKVAKELDVCGKRCPMPILLTKREIKNVEVGEILKVIATDVGTKKDFPAWAVRTGNEIVELTEQEGRFTWHIRRIK